MNPLALALFVALGALCGGALRGRLTQRALTGWPLVGLNCAGALGLGGLFGLTPVLHPAVLCAGAALFAALSPLTDLAGGQRPTPDGAAEVVRTAARFGAAVLGQLIYASAFAIVGFVLTFALIKSWGY